VNNRFMTAGIILALVLILVFIVFGTRHENKTSRAADFRSVKALISEGRLDEAEKKLDALAQKKPDLAGLGKMYFEVASLYEKNKNIVKARDIYAVILKKYQNIDNILEVQDALGKLNIDILFSHLITDKDISYTVEPGDTLSKIAKKFGTTVSLIKTANGLKSDVIRANSRFKISRHIYTILIDKSQNLLTLFSDGSLLKVYKVSTGKNNSTPVGTFKIITKIKDPVWYTQHAVVPAESPDNILGSRWLGLSEKGYGIHGTVDPGSVGQQVTKGCIRMLNPEVEELFTIVPRGTEVTIVD